MQTVKNHDNYDLERCMRWIAYKRLPKEYRRNDVLNWLVGRKKWGHVQQVDVVIG